MPCHFVQMAVMSMGLEHVSRIRTNGIGMNTIRVSNSLYSDQLEQFVRESSGSEVECLTRDRGAAGFKPRQRHSVVSLSKTH